jgi:FkbM family methyltransferase
LERLGPVRKVARARAVGRLASPLLRPVLHRFSFERIARNRLLAAAIRTPIPDEWFSVRIPGASVIVLPSGVAPFLYWAGLGGFEPDLVPSFLRRVLAARTFVDVGANFGFYSVAARAANPDVHVHAVEPNPHVADLLRETVARNGGGIIVHEVAVCDRDGAATLSLRGGLSSMVPERWEAGDELAEVPAVRFDTLFPEGADLVKIDTEGAEVSVLAGMERTLSARRPSILCEIAAETAADVAAFARGHDYRILLLPGERPADAVEIAEGSSVNVVLEPS